jgi:NAD(P)-dependent dehydrogenase (short-subunit alcohol dehydrogenase family)
VEVKASKGRIDVLFANAAVADFAPLGEISEEHFDRIFDVNVRGFLFTVQKALPLMPDGASILLNASIVASTGLPEWAFIALPKPQCVRSRTWTTDLKARRIRINGGSPGFTDTPELNDLLASSEMDATDQQKKTIAQSVPLGRFGTSDEIAKAALFLASDDSSYITGTELFVDGGYAQV